MKRILNVFAFMLVVWFVSAWDCGDIAFKTLLVDVLYVLSGLLRAHFLRALISFVSLGRVEKKKMA